MYSRELELYIGNKRVKFSYTYNKDTTFENLLEFISNFYLEINICPCFNFISKKTNEIINKNDKISNYIKYNNNGIDIMRDIILTNNNQKKKCLCNNILKQKFKKSKNAIIDDFIDLKKELEKQKEELDKLNNALNNICKGNPEVIEKLKNFNIKPDYYKFESNQLIVDKKSGNFIGSKESCIEVDDPVKFYDVIINIKSIKDIIKGWDIKFSERINKNYKEFIKDKVLKIGVIGNSNKGKSFLLSKISKIELPSGTSINTQGLSIKYPVLDEYKDRKIALLDSAGLETTVLKEDNEKEKKEEENEIINENEKQEENGKNKGNKDEIKLNKVEKTYLDYFEEKSREKLITEFFLQNYIIHYSDILIVVVGILTYSEQKLLNKIKIEMQRAKIHKTLFIIHNLMTYTKVKQVKDYINNFLLKSATFTLEKQDKITTQLSRDTGVCYYEKDNNNNKNDNQKIFHLIFANEGSEAGNYYNNYTLNFLENSYKQVINIKPFDVLETIKERFKNISNGFIEKFSDEIVFDDSNPQKIRLKKPEEIILKRCFIDELGFSNLRANGFEPTYNYYQKGNSIIIRVEAPGNCELNSKIDFRGEKTIININGNKKKDKEPKELKDNTFNNREMGTFNLKIPLNSNEFKIKNTPPKILKKNGLFIINFELETEMQIGQYKQPENEEV